MRRQWVAALRMFVAITVVTGVLYPAAVTAFAELTMRRPADGSLVTNADGTVAGSSLIGQAVHGSSWFHGRPDPYDPTASGPSNLGPTNPALGKAAADAAGAVRDLEHLPTDAPLPVDAVTSGGSGLDPDISVSYARLQAPRVASARALSLGSVLTLIDEHTAGRTFGILGEPRVNVLLLNLALEGLASGS